MQIGNISTFFELAGICMHRELLTIYAVLYTEGGKKTLKKLKKVSHKIQKNETFQNTQLKMGGCGYSDTTTIPNNEI